MTRALWTGLLAVLLGSALAGRAEAAQEWRSCPEGASVRCTTVEVPLDRSGVVPGTVPLRVARLRRPRDARDDAPVMLYLSGGPGGAGVGEMISVVGNLPDLARRFVVLGFDQRGTGRSGLIRCPEMQRDGRFRSTSAAAGCAARLGARRAFYTTPDSVEDIEAIRRALRVRRMMLFGISYGTELALQYARAHPEAVERLVLDSVVDPDDRDPFGLAGFRAMPHTLEALCPADCRGISADPAGDLARLTAALRAEPLRSRVYDAAGRGRMRTLTPTGISDLMYDADYAPQLRAAVPAGVRAALEHADPAPLLRLQQLVPLPLTEPEPAAYFSAGRYATVCEETPLPWDATTPPAERAAVARARAEALGEEAFLPFDAAVAFADEIELCLRWPVPFRPAPAPPGPYPDVPALLLQGEEDLRTPPSASAAVAARLPQAQRVVVPGVGHAVVAADPSGCGQRRLHGFLEGRRVGGRCPRVPTGVPPVEVPPVRFAAMRTRPGLPARAGRTIDAVRATLVDVAAAAALAVPGGGLRGGRYTVAGTRLVLEDVVVVPGVRVTGRIGITTADLRITGAAAARGRLRLDERGRLTGHLGGRPIDLRPRAARVRVAGFGARPGLSGPPSRRLPVSAAS